MSIPDSQRRFSYYFADHKVDFLNANKATEEQSSEFGIPVGEWFASILTLDEIVLEKIGRVIPKDKAIITDTKFIGVIDKESNIDYTLSELLTSTDRNITKVKNKMILEMIEYLRIH